MKNNTITSQATANLGYGNIPVSTFKSFSILLKKEFMVVIGGIIHKKRKGTMVAGYGSLIIFGALIVIMLTSTSVTQTVAFSQMGQAHYGVMLNFVTAAMLGLVLALTSMSANKTSNDAQMLLALPIKRDIVVMSKTVATYIYDLGAVALITLPSIVTYVFVADKASPLIIPRGILIILLIPLLFVALTYFINSIMAKLRSKFKFADKIITVLSMLILVSFILITTSTTSTVDMANQNSQAGQSSVLNAMEFPPFTFIKEFIFDGNILSLLYLILICIIPFYLAIKVYSSGFGQSVANYQSKVKTLSFSDGNIKKALFQKEIKRYFDSSLYVMNTIMGPVLMVLFTVMLIFNFGPFAQIFNTPELKIVGDDTMFVIVTTILCFCMCLTTTTASSISLESKQIWIIKSLPIGYSAFFFAKIKVNLVITLPVAIVCGAAIGITQGFSPVNTILTAVFPAVCAILISFVGLLVNLHFPKLDWSTEISVIKQSTSVLLSMGFGFLISGAPIILYLLVLGDTIPPALYYLIIGVVYALLTVLCWVGISTRGQRLFSELV